MIGNIQILHQIGINWMLFYLVTADIKCINASQIRCITSWQNPPPSLARKAGTSRSGYFCDGTSLEALVVKTTPLGACMCGSKSTNMLRLFIACIEYMQADIQAQA